MIKQLPLPKIVYVIRVVWRNLIIAGHNIIIFPIVVLIVGGKINWSILLWPIGLVVSIVTLSGLALLFGIVAARYRDLPQIVNAVLTVCFYLTPVLWIKESLGDDELVNAIVTTNPLYHILQVARLPLIGESPSIDNWVWVLGSAVIFWTAGLFMFKKYEKRIAYWV
jgi:lipopolysaccharide transport system permease protein